MTTYPNGVTPREGDIVRWGKELCEVVGILSGGGLNLDELKTDWTHYGCSPGPCTLYFRPFKVGDPIQSHIVDEAYTGWSDDGVYEGSKSDAKLIKLGRMRHINPLWRPHPDYNPEVKDSD